jgi:radical SAM superfamily enzyme YgiQ (UPF0313 family)
VAKNRVQLLNRVIRSEAKDQAAPERQRNEETTIMKIAFIAVDYLGIDRWDIAGDGFKSVPMSARNRALANLPSLALLTLAGWTPHKHEMQYFHLTDLEKNGGLPDGFDLIALSSYTAGIEKAYAVAAHYRERGVLTVIGGPHVSLLPDEAAEHVDAVAIGEGEVCWQQILEDAQRGELNKFYGSLDAGFNLDDSVLPAFELLDPRRHNRITVETSRGCPHRCEFCASSVLLSRRYKQKPIGKVLSEIDRVLELWPRPFIEFADDNTFVNRNYWYDLLPELKERHIRWFAEADVRLGQEERLLELLRESGCRQVLLGLESPTTKDLQGIELNNNWKMKQTTAAEDVVRTIQSHGILVNGCFVVGLDGQGPDIFESIYDFVRATNVYDVQITVMTPFPGTHLYARLLKENRLIEERAWSKATLFDVNFTPSHMSVKTLEEGFRKLAIMLYDEDFTKQRRARLRGDFRVAAAERKERKEINARKEFKERKAQQAVSSLG